MSVKGISISSKRGIIYIYWRENGVRKGQSLRLVDSEENRLKALELAIKKKRELNKPIPNPYIYKTLYDAIDDFPKDSPVYRSAFNLLKSKLKDIHLRDITELHFHNLNFDNYSHNTKATYFKHYRIFFNWLLENKLVDKNPVPKIKHTKGKQIEVLGFTELRRAYNLFKGNPKHLFAFKFLYKSGFRLGEAARLNYEDIQNGIIYVKNRKANRIDQYPLKPVQKLLDMQKIEQYRLKKNISHSVLGFKSTNGFYRMRKKMREEFNGQYTLKGLRSTFATRWAYKLTPYELQKLMRHTDIRTTMKYYVGIDIKSIGRKM